MRCNITGCLLAALVLSIQFSIAQEAEQGQDFSLNPNSIGGLQNSVNLYTGQVGFPMTVAALPGRGGLKPQVVIQYSSAGVKKNVNTWNREAPTGLLGLGWSLDFPKIVSDHNGTVSRHDDTFYLLEGGSSVKLVCTDFDDGGAGYRTYETKMYQPWTIKYYYAQEKWVIEKDDGTRYVYGDDSRGRTAGTIQYMVAWNNWIGDSKETLYQKKHAYIWNLSEVINLWDDKMTYSYDNIEEEVGDHPDPGAAYNPYHTKASALKRITGPTGNYIELNYAMKIYEGCHNFFNFRCDDRPREYQDPHIQAPEPDAYQEKYEPRYLESIAAFDEKGSTLYEVDFEYNDGSLSWTTGWLGRGEFAKRMLTGVQQTNDTGTSLPGTSFTYFQDGAEKGHLKMVTNSIGGEVTYQYESTSKLLFKVCYDDTCNEIKAGTVGIRDLEVTAPGDINEYYAEPNLFTGPDYVVVVWRKVDPFYCYNLCAFEHPGSPRSTKLQVYEWKGEWIKHELGSIGDLRLSYDIKDHEMVVDLARDHFGVALRQGTHDYRVNLFHKNGHTGGWDSFNENVYLKDGRLADAQYLSELFFKAGPDHMAFGNLTTPTLYLYRWTGKNWERRDVNHSSSAVNAYGGASNYVLAEDTYAGPLDDFWIHYLTEDGRWAIQAFDGDFDTDTMESEKYASDITRWHCAPSFAFVMADDNPEYIFELDEDYQRLKRTTTQALPDYYPVYWRKNGMFNISAYKEDEFGERAYTYVYRFNGISWKSFRSSAKMTKGAGDNFGKSTGLSDVFLRSYDANKEGWISEHRITSEARFDRYIQMADDHSALMGTGIYYREPNGKWLDIGDISVQNHGDHSWSLDLSAGPGTFYSSIPYSRTQINRVVNGRVVQTEMPYNMNKRRKYYSAAKRLAGPDMFAMFETGQNFKADARSFKLFKWSDEGYRSGHEAVVVSSVSVSDGNVDLNKAYDYKHESARMDASGSFPFFNEVKVVNGSKKADVTPRGYTKHFFYNGKPLSELPHIPAEQAGDEALLFAGNPYRAETRDNMGNLLSSSETVYTTYFKDIDNSDGDLVGQSHYVRPTWSSSHEYSSGGTKKLTTVTTYNEYGFPADITQYSSDDALSSKVSSSESFTYYPSRYDIDSHHIISEIIGSKKENNGEVISSIATVWQSVDDIPRATRVYQWKGYGSSDFDAWQGGTPPVQWYLDNAIERRDDKGNILTSHNFMGEQEAAVYDDLKRNPLASASYATYEQIAATSFEAGQPGKFSTSDFTNEEAYTGVRSHTQGSASIEGLPAGRYDLYYWYKGGPGMITVSNGNVENSEDLQTAKGWTLRKCNVVLTGAGGLTFYAATNTFIDEVRIHPEDAYMSTFVYDDKQQKVAETDADMQTTFFYYDDLDRQHYVTDQQGNIVLYYEYGFKNLNND